MKNHFINFIKRYDNQIKVDQNLVDFIDYENKAKVYFDFKNQKIKWLVNRLKGDFDLKLDVLQIDASESYFVYIFYIPPDKLIDVDDTNNRMIYYVETEVFLIGRNRKEVYHEYLQTEEWFNKRNKVLKFSDYKCNRCASLENIQVHHLNYNTIGSESMGDLEVLCNNCHKKAHNIIG